MQVRGKDLLEKSEKHLFLRMHRPKPPLELQGWTLCLSSRAGSGAWWGKESAMQEGSAVDSNSKL